MSCSNRPIKKPGLDISPTWFPLKDKELHNEQTFIHITQNGWCSRDGFLDTPKESTDWVVTVSQYVLMKFPLFYCWIS